MGSVADNLKSEKSTHKAWAACPNCNLDLAIKSRESKRPLRKCPFCGVALVEVWWQRCLVSAIALILTFAFPAALGIRDIMGLLLAGLVCVFPALICAHILVFKIIPPRYVRKDLVLTLLQH